MKEYSQALEDLDAVIALQPDLAAAYLNRAPALVYAGYAAPARTLGISAVNDQQQAGAIMWVGGSCLMIAVGLRLAMVSMISEERRQAARERHALVGAAPRGGAATGETLR